MLVKSVKFMSLTLISKSYFTNYIAISAILSLANSYDELSPKFPENLYVPDRSLSLVEGDRIILDQIQTILPMDTILIDVTKLPLPSGSQFLVIQAHAHNFNLTISYNQTLIPHYHVNGTNIGLVVTLQKGPLPNIYVSNFNISRNVSALFAAVAYGRNVPVPGGCNMVFPIETSPFLGITYNKAVVRVDVQPASPPVTSSETCELSSVELEIYHSYFPERDYSTNSYFNSIRKMLTVDSIRKNGVKVNEPLEGATMRRVFSAYTGTGAAYGIIAVYEEDGKIYESAYVPSVTYACSTVLWADTCQVLTTTFAKVFCAVLFFMGLFMCLFGHMFFRSQIFMHSFLSGSLIAVIVFYPFLNKGLYPAALCFGLALAFICVFFWQICSMPFFHVLLISLNMGFLLASTLFYAGLGDVDLMESDINFWILFSVIVLFAPSVLVYLSHKACIVVSGVLGAYAVIVPIDHYIGSNLKFIILNTIKRATIPEFRSAVISPPYQYKDLTLTLVWLMLSAVGISMQLFLQRASPPFPPPPREVCGICSYCFSSPSRMTTDERTPLLVDARIPQRTPPEGYDDVFEPIRRPTAPPAHLMIAQPNIVIAN